MSGMDVAALRALAEAATPGPWETITPAGTGIAPAPHSDRRGVIGAALESKDAAFITAANPSTVLALLDELEPTTDDRAVRLALEVGRLTREREELRATLARVEALAEATDARRLEMCRACRDAEFARLHSHGCATTREWFAGAIRDALEGPA